MTRPFARCRDCRAFRARAPTTSAVSRPAYAGAMAFLTNITIGDLDDCYELCRDCRACRTMRPLPLPAQLERLGAAFRIGQVRRRLRCQDCGGRECGRRECEIRLVRVGRN